jgi:uncharacterized protein YutE (UPF0331/DUF86 family)
MEEITKAITMEKALADRIQELAHKERRSFAREAQVLLESALDRYKMLEKGAGSEPE